MTPPLSTPSDEEMEHMREVLRAEMWKWGVQHGKAEMDALARAALAARAGRGRMTQDRYSFDDECLKLAEYFLHDAKVRPSKSTHPAKELAQAIQDTIEDWLESNE